MKTILNATSVTVFFNLAKKKKNQSKQAQAKSQKRETYSEQKRTKDVNTIYVGVWEGSLYKVVEERGDCDTVKH